MITTKCSWRDICERLSEVSPDARNWSVSAVWAWELWFLWKLLFKEWKRRDTRRGWVIFTFLSHLQSQTQKYLLDLIVYYQDQERNFALQSRLIPETCGCHTFRISLNCTETRDQFAWCRRRTVVYGNGWVIFVIIPIHCHVSFQPSRQF